MAGPLVLHDPATRNPDDYRPGECRRPTLSPEYNAWQKMKDRCHNPNNQDAKNYGERGIEVCSLWRDDYKAFLAHVGRRPSPKHTLERLDVNGHYEPGNVAWKTWKEQQNNRRNNVLLTYAGRTLTMAQWAEETGIPYYTLYARVRKLGLPLQQALEKKLEHRRCEHLVTHAGKTLSLTGWAAETGLPYGAIKKRLRNGWSPERALTGPVALEKSHRGGRSK